MMCRLTVRQAPILQPRLVNLLLTKRRNPPTRKKLADIEGGADDVQADGAAGTDTAAETSEPVAHQEKESTDAKEVAGSPAEKVKDAIEPKIVKPQEPKPEETQRSETKTSPAPATPSAPALSSKQKQLAATWEQYRRTMDRQYTDVFQSVERDVTNVTKTLQAMHASTVETAKSVKAAKRHLADIAQALDAVDTLVVPIVLQGDDKF
mmetsp:Transcript_15869/g.42891  ORF Transcript_15869/g.42891 Transcript_15869/m.42891 type:complete len:208 (-) Transcript_15869:2769-3392(-)